LANKVTVKELGASYTLTENFGKPILDKLNEIFPDCANEIFTISILRAIHQCPMKNIKYLYNDSYLSNKFNNLDLSGKNISNMMKEIGARRTDIVCFMKNFIAGSEHIAFDMTDIVSSSKKLGINALGKCASGFDRKVNLLYAFSISKNSPAYYRILPGNIRDVSSLELSLKEAGIEDAVIVADKGFASKANFETIKAIGAKFIMPLRRSSNMIVYEKFEKTDRSVLDGYFIHEKRIIWHYSYTNAQNGLKISTFLDESLRVEECYDYMERINSNCEGFTNEKFTIKNIEFGTISIATSIDSLLTAKEIYINYKQRMQVENVFDTFKNVLEADRTYASNEHSLECWMFFNHIAMMLLYDLYRVLIQNDLLGKYSVKDILILLSQIRTLKIQDSWVKSEVTSKTATILKKLNINILPN